VALRGALAIRDRRCRGCATRARRDFARAGVDMRSARVFSSRTRARPFLAEVVFMKASRLSFLFLSLLLSAATIPLACGSSKTAGDAGFSDSGARGTGGAMAGTGGNTGAGGKSGTGGSTAIDAGPSGTGGAIVMVDAAGNTFTCADLMACCNSITNAQGKALCLTQYNQLMSQGNMACGNLLAQLKANNVCQ
jgi:hypothetical protein